MKVAVTGAAGFIGSHVCEALVARGDEVVAIDGFVNTLYAAEPKHANWLSLAIDGIERIEADLRDVELEPILQDVDAVLNLAAVPGLAPSWQHFDSYSSCNLSVVERLSKAAVNVELPRFVQVSTSSVYGATATGDETSPLRPVSPYGVTKLAAETLIGAYRMVFGLDALVVRLFSIYGPRQRPDMAYHRFIEAMRNDQPVTIYGDGLQTRTNTYVADCVAGILLALDHGENGEAYNIGGGVSISLLEAVNLLGEIMGRTPKLVFEDARPGDQRDTRADTTKARSAIGYRPVVTPAEGLERQVAWHQARSG